MNMDYEKALAEMYETSQKWLEELGIGDQMPSVGVFRLLHSVVMDFWSEEASEHEGYEGIGFNPKEVSLRLEPTLVPISPAALELQAIDKEGTAFPIGVVVPEGDYMLLKGHKITIGSLNEVEARHGDGSLCEIGCRFCEEPDVRLSQEPRGYFAECAHCGAMTEPYEEKFIAIAAWTLGRIEA